MSNEILTINKNGQVGRFKKGANLVAKVLVILKIQYQDKGLWNFLFSATGKKLVVKFFKKIVSIVVNNDIEERKKLEDYTQWRRKNVPAEEYYSKAELRIKNFTYSPKISVLVPVYNTPPAYLEAAVNSLLGQLYANWELCLADDNSTSPETKQVLEKYAALDLRIKVVFRKNNGHISASTNSALQLATGEFCALFDHDDLLVKEALYEVVNFLNENPQADFIYSDEDKTDGEGVFMQPHFKPSWCPDNLLSRNYIGHLTVVRTSILKEIGGFKEGLEGSQDYDLYLRYTERTKNIFHLPKVLYHWRMHENSVAFNTYSKSYAYLAGKKAIEEALLRRKEEGRVEMLEDDMLGFYSIRYEIKEYKKVSIIIPAKNKMELLKQCVDSIFSKSTYKDFEVIVIDNGSTEKDFFDLIENYSNKYKNKFVCYHYDVPFNFSKLINYGAEKASGDYLLLLNNDTKIITPDWIEAMVEQAQRASIGVVGAKLLFPDETVQHAGIIFDKISMPKHVFAGESKYLCNLPLNSINNYPAITGACQMIKRSLFEFLHGYDEDFAIEFNDIDFCLKAIKQGYYNVYLPHVELYHYESVSRGSSHSTAEKYERYLKEHERFVKTWSAYIENYTIENINLLNFN
jgi:glycosyltransferase involved in cell wall biosynthesis